MYDINLLSIIFIGILSYAILKEREELGCFRISVEQQCDDQSSVYLLNTKMKQDDTLLTLKNRLKSILSYSDKGGVWKRCVIISTILCIFVYILNNFCYTNNSKFYYYALLVLLFFSAHYFYFNYLNYHHFRNLKLNGVEIIDHIFDKYITQK